MRRRWGGLWTCETGGIGYLPQALASCYFPNASKTWLVTKDGFHDAVSIFTNRRVNVTPNGRPYLGAATCSHENVTGQVESMVNKWISNIKCLATVAVTQLHAAFSALTYELMSKWTYLSRTVPDVGPLLRPLVDVLRSVLLPALTGRPPPSDLECTLFALPTKQDSVVLR